MHGRAILSKQARLQLEKTFAKHVNRKAFIPGKSRIQYAGIVSDANEFVALTEAMLEGWLAVGRRALEFEQRFANLVERKLAVFVNSGSSANLLAVSSLIAQGRLRKGDEAVTPAVTFPTTLNPLIQQGLRPVLVDVNPRTYDVDPTEVKKAISPKTRLLMIPHTLGNPCDMLELREISDKHDLMIIEDCCDALGSRFGGKPVGTFGELATFSFAAPHHMSTGEGGMVVTNDPDLALCVRSLRDCGRIAIGGPKAALRYDPSVVSAAHRRKGSLPSDYDARFVYSSIGYGLRPTELQASLGLVQMEKLEMFRNARKRNFNSLYGALRTYGRFLMVPESLPLADPCWFAFPITVKPGSPFRREELIGWLEEHNIETRPLFAGNILRQPGYFALDCRRIGPLRNADFVMHNSFFVGVYPGIGRREMDYVIETFEDFFHRYPNSRN